MDDQTNVAAHPNRPEIFITRLVQLVEAHARIGWVHLQIKGGGLDGFLLLAGKFGETICEGIGDAEVQGDDYRLNVGIARIMKSSKRGTVKSMSPCAGL